MIRFVSISSFRSALGELLKVKNRVYSNVPNEICKAFQGVSIEQIRANRDMILMDSDSITIKLRLPDKRQRLSKADGYRLIYMVLKSIPVVVFLTVYPKRGPKQKLNVEELELQRLVNEFTYESMTRQLVVHDIEDTLKQSL
ncbi:MAG: hypothetical protein K6C07_07265 [Bacteroidales bacterium]|nr:hypothetical protein [Bacteroidales bacterium]